MLQLSMNVINCCALIGVVILKCVLLKEWIVCTCSFSDPLGVHRYSVRSTLQKHYRNNLMSSQKVSVPFPFQCR